MAPWCQHDRDLLMKNPKRTDRTDPIHPAPLRRGARRVQQLQN